MEISDPEVPAEVPSRHVIRRSNLFCNPVEVNAVAQPPEQRRSRLPSPAR